ncbi:MAG: hypothetical protein ACXWJM_05880 [Ramlibacter sp.]
MPTWKAVLAIATAFGTQVYAATDDPLHSAECADARAALEAALGEPQQTHRDHPERLAQARKQVADLCLGRMSGHAQRTGAPEPPITVPAPVIEPPRTVRARPPVTVPAPAPLEPRAAAITACDPAGCWDSNGQRLNNVGPLLLGPRGICVPLAGQVTCP